jgi:hypothetical protein
MKLLEKNVNKTYYVIDIKWSQTDCDTIIVYAKNRDEALEMAKAKYSVRYIEIVRESDKLIKIK